MKNLSSCVLKDAFESISFELTNLFNSCIEYSLKRRVKEREPIFQKHQGANNDPEDWRPITQVELPGKVLGWILHA